MADADGAKPRTLATLPSGKEIQYVRKGTLGTIQWSDGGVVPEALQGGFSDIRNAQSAVNSYILTRRETKPRKKKEQ